MNKELLLKTIEIKEKSRKKVLEFPSFQSHEKRLCSIEYERKTNIPGKIRRAY